ncbi:PHD finger protein ING1-like [Hibiscus syriacus]|nr:PHD finger protein ING1-like [Hibiscus syriacus]
MSDEELRRERENVAATAEPAPSRDSTTKSGRSSQSGRGGRKKARLATAAAENPAGMELDLPVDSNEPTYCLFNQVSYGEMVACDNPSATQDRMVSLRVVGLREQPRGK